MLPEVLEPLQTLPGVLEPLPMLPGVREMLPMLPGVPELPVDATKARKSSFLSKNAGTLLTGGLVAGGVLYLDDKYKQEEKDVKDCMKVCLPDNWDDHAYGDLDKSDLKYKELSDVGSAEQPICTPQIENCGAYCGDKCKEIHDYDAPGSGLVGGLAGDAGDATGGVPRQSFRWPFRWPI